MQGKALASWNGVLSVLWVTAWFVLLPVALGVFDRLAELGQALVWTFGLLGWWGVGLLLAISGLRRGNLPSRVCGFLTVVAFALFMFSALTPISRTVRHNKSALGNGAMLVLLQIEHPLPSMPEQHC